MTGQARPGRTVGSGGFVHLVDHMGNDAAIVQAARISYGDGTKTPSDDRTLIRYLMRHWHTTPFEMCEVKFHVKVPMDAWRQWIRHRTASVNEYSTRYSEAIDEMEVTLPGEWRLQSTANKQGSGGFLERSVGEELSKQEAEFHTLARGVYQSRLDHGVAREQARKDLPLSTYTMAFWKVDLHNLFHFLRLRMDSHAQKEIRDFANAIYELVRPLFPEACAAFQDYRLEAMTLSRLDVEMLSAFVTGRWAIAADLMDEFGWKRSSREYKEFLVKAARCGVEEPDLFLLTEKP